MAGFSSAVRRSPAAATCSSPTSPPPASTSSRRSRRRVTPAGDNFNAESGTSMSGPHIAGWRRSLQAPPGWSRWVKSALMTTASPDNKGNPIGPPPATRPTPLNFGAGTSPRGVQPRPGVRAQARATGGPTCAPSVKARPAELRGARPRSTRATSTTRRSPSATWPARRRSPARSPTSPTGATTRRRRRGPRRLQSSRSSTDTSSRWPTVKLEHRSRSPGQAPPGYNCCQSGFMTVRQGERSPQPHCPHPARGPRGRFGWAPSEVSGDGATARSHQGRRLHRHARPRHRPVGSARRSPTTAGPQRTGFDTPLRRLRRGRPKYDLSSLPAGMVRFDIDAPDYAPTTTSTSTCTTKGRGRQADPGGAVRAPGSADEQRHAQRPGGGALRSALSSRGFASTTGTSSAFRLDHLGAGHVGGQPHP